MNLGRIGIYWFSFEISFLCKKNQKRQIKISKEMVQTEVDETARIELLDFFSIQINFLKSHPHLKSNLFVSLTMVQSELFT